MPSSSSRKLIQSIKQCVVQGVTAFLERTNWLKACSGEARPLLPGAVLPVTVTAAARPGRPLVHVSADPKSLAKGAVKEWEGLTIGSLLPGMLVNARVRNVLSDGLLVSFLTYFNGTVDCFHLSQVTSLILLLNI